MGRFLTLGGLIAAFLAVGGPPESWAQAPHQIYWRQVGGPWSTGPYPSQTPTCIHGHAMAACNGQNFKGNYRHGQTTLFWLNGCNQPPLTIRCEVRSAAAPVANPQRPISQFATQGGAGCPAAGRYKSVRSQQKAPVSFANRSDRAINVYWLDFNGQPREYAALLPGESKSFSSYVGHFWIAKSFDGRCAGGLHAVNPGNNAIVLR